MIAPAVVGLALSASVSATSSTAVSATPATPAVSLPAASSFRLPEGVKSHKLKDGFANPRSSCRYSVIYGMYGTAPYATLRVYGGACRFFGANPGIGIYDTVGREHWSANDPSGGGDDDDGCGPFYYWHVVGTPGGSIDHVQVWMPARSHRVDFSSDPALPQPEPVVMLCDDGYSG